MMVYTITLRGETASGAAVLEVSGRGDSPKDAYKAAISKLGEALSESDDE